MTATLDRPTAGRRASAGPPLAQIRTPLAAFRDALARATTAVPSRTTLPIMQCVLISAHAATDDAPARCTLFATDLDRAITAAVVPDDADALTVVGTVRVALPAASLTAALQHAAGDTLTLTLRDERRVELQIGQARYRLSGPDPDEMPDPRGARLDGTADVVGATRVPAGALQRAVRRVSYATSTEASRQTAQGVCWVPVGDLLRLAAVDGRRAAEVELPTLAGLTAEAIMPRLTADQMARVFTGDELVAVTIDGGVLSVASDRCVLSVRCIEGPFPQYRQHRRATSALTVTIDRSAFAAAVQRVAFASDSDFRAMGMHFAPLDAPGAPGDGATCRLWTSTPDRGAATDTVACALTGDATDFTIGCGAGFLLDALTKTFTGARVCLGLDTPRGVILVTDPDDASGFVFIGSINLPADVEA